LNFSSMLFDISSILLFSFCVSAFFHMYILRFSGFCLDIAMLESTKTISWSLMDFVFLWQMSEMMFDRSLECSMLLLGGLYADINRLYAKSYQTNPITKYSVKTEKMDSEVSCLQSSQIPTVIQLT
jgi:hypothetical protein